MGKQRITLDSGQIAQDRATHIVLYGNDVVSHELRQLFIYGTHESFGLLLHITDR